MTLKETIATKIRNAFQPVHLDVYNESHKHAVPAGSESHFKVTIVSDKFAGQTLLERHRGINALLADELRSGLHALALNTLTPAEWQARGGQVPASPPCLGAKENK